MPTQTLEKKGRIVITCTIEELTNRKCKWPIGDPQDKDFKFCGNSSHDDNSSYCEFHTQMAYRYDYVSRREKQIQKKMKSAA